MSKPSERFDIQQFTSRLETYEGNLFPTSKSKILQVTLVAFRITTPFTLKHFCYFWKRVIRSCNTFFFKILFFWIGNTFTRFKIFKTCVSRNGLKIFSYPCLHTVCISKENQFSWSCLWYMLQETAYQSKYTYAYKYIKVYI